MSTVPSALKLCETYESEWPVLPVQNATDQLRGRQNQGKQRVMAGFHGLYDMKHRRTLLLHIPPLYRRSTSQPAVCSTRPFASVACFETPSLVEPVRARPGNQRVNER